MRESTIKKRLEVARIQGNGMCVFLNRSLEITLFPKCIPSGVMVISTSPAGAGCLPVMACGLIQEEIYRVSGNRNKCATWSRCGITMWQLVGDM